MNALHEAVRRELENPAPIGRRHHQIVRLACLLRASGFSTNDIFHRLRANYDPVGIPDAEIAAALNWAEKRIPHPVHRVTHPVNLFSALFIPRKKPGFVKSRENLTGDVHRVVNEFLRGFSFGEPDLFDASPIKIPGDFRNDARLVFESLYSASEKLNIVTRYREQTTGKTSPLGFGETLFRDEWLSRFQKRVPENKAGAWFRINPVNGMGISDADISEFRFALLESDFLPLEIQISIFAKLPLPICTIIKSGGKSLHAWVRIGAKTPDQYREKVSRLFSRLAPFGFDTANRNPSRLSRLPGAQRMIGATGDGQQSLLYLNPDATERTIA